MLKRQLLFHGFHETAWFLLSLVLLAAAAGLIVYLLRLERRLVSPRVGRWLLVLRLSVLAVLLLTFLQPVLSWKLDQERAGRIVVAVDLSQSMTTTDAHASPDEKLSWARALGLIGNEATDERLDRWADAFRAGREPEWSDGDAGPDGVPPEDAELSALRQENLAGVFRELDAISRKELMLRLLTGPERGVLEQLDQIANVEIVVFAGGSAAVDSTTLTTVAEEPPSSLEPDVSDLAQVLAASFSGAEGTQLEGVVLFSDGRNNGLNDPVAGAQRLGQMYVPVHPVAIGSLHKPKDLAVVSIDYPQKVFRNDKPVARVVVGTAGYAGQTVRVTLSRPGAETVARTIVPQGDSAMVEFELEAEELGRYEYQVLAEPLPDETREDNNERTFAISVINDTLKVLLIEGAARWEFRFIDNALSRDERVEVSKVVFEQPYLGVLEDTFFPRQLPIPADPGNLVESPFSEVDLVIVGDVSPQVMTESVWQMLEQYVAEASGTVVITAGKRFMPQAFRSPALDRLLPVTAPQPLEVDGLGATGSPTDRGFRLQLTPDGESEPMLQFATDPVENRRIWAGLPGHLWGLFGPAKRGATVYATAVQANELNALETEREAAVIVHQHYGFGQVLWIGIDSTWRWRFRVGDTYHHRFWGQLCRWAAENKALAGNEFVRFGPSESDIETGEDVLIRARWTRQFFREHPGLAARARIARMAADGEVQDFSTVELQPDDRHPLVFSGRAVSLPAGRYRVRLEADGVDFGGEPVEASLYVHERTSAELSEMSVNLQLLQQIADASGGRVFFPHELAELPEQFTDPEALAALRRETELWDHWSIMLVFFTLLTAEWVVRKLNGLP